MLRAPIAGMSFTPGEIRLNLWGSLDEKTHLPALSYTEWLYLNLGHLKMMSSS